MNRSDLLRHPAVAAALRSRWPSLVVSLAALAGFVLAIAAGFAGTPVGSRNFGIIAVWIAWWAVLILVAVPLLGRAWCSICPLPLPGVWLQRGGVLAPSGKRRGLGLRWPRRLRGLWIQNAGFALIAVFSTAILSQPAASAAVLLGLMGAALILSLIFERRAFCSHVCPVGGFIGLYSQLAPIELRARDRQLCASHREKTCYTGSPQGEGCPWQTFPAGLDRNSPCGMCFECLRTCPYDNIAIRLRPFGADLPRAAGRRLDEAYKAFLMVASALAYSAVLLGPWGEVKLAAFRVGSGEWWIYTAAFLGFAFLGLPGLFALHVAAGRTLGGLRSAMRESVAQLAQSLIPLGLAAWAAFSLSFVLTNLSYLWPVLSDPLGAGWNVLGTASAPWIPYLGGALPALQTGVLMIGLVSAASIAVRTARRVPGATDRSARRTAGPVVVFAFGVTVVQLWLLIG
jgi:ferredoxin